MPNVHRLDENAKFVFHSSVSRYEKNQGAFDARVCAFGLTVRRVRVQHPAPGQHIIDQNLLVLIVRTAA